jgi:hypothetical protein
MFSLEPGRILGRFYCNSLGLALFGTGFDRVVTLVDSQTGFARAVSTEADVTSCTRLVGVEKFTPEWQREITRQTS